MNITVGIPTKDRYESLDKTLLSIAFQTLKPKQVIIVDDSHNPRDIREIPHYEYILRLFTDKGIDWRVIYGERKGQHFCHQIIQDEAKTDYIFRIDDDEVAEPSCLRKLAETMKLQKNQGAVGPAVLNPNPTECPLGLRNRITNMEAPNQQWFKGTGVYEADHLTSSFLYKKGIAKWNLALSTVAHREETMFTYDIKRAGYEVEVNLDAVVHHFRGGGGGIRSFNDGSLWDHDEKIFQGYLAALAIGQKSKIIVLDSGLGDHYAFLHILPALQKQYKQITIAACFPDVFYEFPDIKLISIAEAKMMFGNIDNFNIYKYMGDRNWKKSLVEAFEELYLPIKNEDNNITIQPKAEKRKAEPKELPILGGGYRKISV